MGFTSSPATDTFGYMHFQCIVDGRDVLTADRGRLVPPHPVGGDPGLQAAPFTLDRRGCAHLGRPGGRDAPSGTSRTSCGSWVFRGRPLGVEYEAYGLTAAKGKAARPRALEGDFRLVDQSGLISALRAVKSRPSSPTCAARRSSATRRSRPPRRRAAPGVFEGDILADMHGAIAPRGRGRPGETSSSSALGPAP